MCIKHYAGLSAKPSVKYIGVPQNYIIQKNSLHLMIKNVKH